MNEKEEARTSIKMTVIRLVVTAVLFYCLWGVIHNVMQTGGRWWFNFDLLKMNLKYIIGAAIAATACNYLEGNVPKDEEEDA